MFFLLVAAQPFYWPALREPQLLDVSSSSQVCEYVLQNFYIRNKRLCELLSTDMPVDPHQSLHNIVQSYDARIFRITEACDAAFKCRVRQQFRECPHAFLQTSLHGEFRMFCPANNPHVRLYTWTISTVSQ